MTRPRPKACWRRDRQQESELKRSLITQICSVLLSGTNAAVHHSPENWGAGLPRPNKGLVQKNRKELVRNTLYLTPRTRQHRPSETKVYKAPCKYAWFTATDRVDIWTATGCLLAWAKCITATRTSVRSWPSLKWNDVWVVHFNNNESDV